MCSVSVKTLCCCKINPMVSETSTKLMGYICTSAQGRAAKKSSNPQRLFQEEGYTVIGISYCTEPMGSGKKQNVGRI